VAIGQGDLPESTVKDRLESTVRHQLPPAAPAGGLALVGVGYEGTQDDALWLNPTA
jgi:tRNA U38,U39,U40 pseudouridine synthase TruA